MSWSWLVTIMYKIQLMSTVNESQSWYPAEVTLLTLLRANHYLGNKVDNGARWLFRVMLRKQVTHIVRGSATFPCNKAKDPAETE